MIIPSMLSYQVDLMPKNINIIISDIYEMLGIFSLFGISYIIIDPYMFIAVMLDEETEKFICGKLINLTYTSGSELNYSLDISNPFLYGFKTTALLE